LVNEIKPAGYHQVNWNVGNLSSGLYIVQMKSGRVQRMQKILLLK
jgi:hypothetical protein